jgi:hypothetical protein
MLGRTMRRARTVVVHVLAAWGCQRSEATVPAQQAGVTEPSTTAVAPEPPPPATTRPTFRRCEAHRGPLTTGREFEHARSRLVAAARPNHAMQDGFAVPGAAVELTAKITYGDGGKDLEDEDVEFALDDCADGVDGTAKTDDDGLARISITAPAQPGAYRVRAVVLGDGSETTATLRVLPEGTELVVFDIDGTLTTTDDEVTRDVLDEHLGHLADGKYAAAAYDHGAALARTWAERGFVIVYLTGRPYWLVDHSRAWLRDGGYPEGLVRTTLRHRDVVPKIDGVGEFKAAYLRGLVDAGYRIAAAHGNASTDVWAYAQASIPAAHTFIIGPHAGEGGTVAVRDDWSAVLPIARDHAPAAQPFAWPSAPSK